MRHIHDFIAHCKEALSRQSLRKEVRHIVVRFHVRHDKLASLHQLAHVEVTSIDVLRARVMLRVVRKVSRALVVLEQLPW